MARSQGLRRDARRFAAADVLPPARSVAVRALDGTRLHAEVFGPEDGYPIVLARHHLRLNFLAADLDAVLEATLKPGERAVIAGPVGTAPSPSVPTR